MKNIFLSASVPLPERNRIYFETADVFLIREAIRALIEVIAPVGTITFGGHPAITPLVSLYFSSMGYPQDRVTVFQSEYFPRITGSDVTNFSNVIYTRAIPGDRDHSLTLMRTEMIKSKKFDSMVVIGGMEGIDEEVKIFQKIHSNALVLPVPSTGAASRIMYNENDFPAGLENEISFASMFRRHLLPRPETHNDERN